MIAARARRKVQIGVAALVTSAALVTGCSAMPTLTIEQIPLPAPGGLSDGYKLRVEFANALNLPAKAKVKVGGNDVGQVGEIKVKNYLATVELTVKKDIKLPMNSKAELRQATPLGDVFVALLPGTDNNKGSLKDGDTIRLKDENGKEQTSAAASVEDLLVSASAFVNGGILGGTTNMIHELSAATGGKSTELVGVIRGFTTAVDRLNKNTAQINRGLDNIRAVSADLAAGRNQLVASIATLGPVLSLVNGQINNVISLVNKSSPITAAMNNFIDTSTGDTIELFRALKSLATDLNGAAGQFGPAADQIAKVLPQWAKSNKGSSAAVSAKLYYLTPGFGFDSGSRLPELNDIPQGVNSLHQTLQRLLARLTGTQGCCG